MTVRAQDDPSIGNLLIAMMSSAGVTIDDESLARLIPLVERSLADWPPLTRAASPSLEPMGCGRWPEPGS